MPDSITYANASSGNSQSYAFGESGAYTIYARIFDKDGGKSDYSTTVTVNNVAPTATARSTVVGIHRALIESRHRSQPARTKPRRHLGGRRESGWRAGSQSGGSGRDHHDSRAGEPRRSQSAAALP